MDACELTQYIIDNNKIEDVLVAIGCFKIKKYNNEYRCGCDKYPTPTSIRIKDTLKVKVFSSNSYFGNIFTLIMDLKEVDFYNSTKIVHDILGIPYQYKRKEVKEVKTDILDIFKKIKVSNKSNCKQDIEIHNECIYDEFVQMPYIGWVREGITPNTQYEFGIGYSRKTNRVILPHRYWCGDKNSYVGVIGRTLNKHYELLDIAKYFPLVSFPKSMNIYGLNENYEHIQKAGYVNVFEAEKSVLKRHSLLDKTGCALGSHDMSSEQAKILISLDVDIIIQMDSDISEQHVWGLCENFYHIRNVYYVYDKFGLLGNKESPADKHNKVYNALWNRKIKYTEEHHKKYLQYMKEKRV